MCNLDRLLPSLVLYQDKRLALADLEYNLDKGQWAVSALLCDEKGGCSDVVGDSSREDV